MTTWHRVTFDAQTEDGGTKRQTVTLQDMTRRIDGDIEAISGTLCDREGDPTDTLQVILCTPGEAVVKPLVQDLVYGTLRIRESAASKAMRGTR